MLVFLVIRFFFFKWNKYSHPAKGVKEKIEAAHDVYQSPLIQLKVKKVDVHRMDLLKNEYVVN